MNPDPVSLYQHILPLMYDNPNGILFEYQFYHELIKFLPLDSYHSVVQYPIELAGPPRVVQYQQWPDRKHEKKFSNIDSEAIKDSEPKTAFYAGIEMAYNDLITRQRAKRPDMKGFHYHRIISPDEPLTMIGFFRFTSDDRDTSFTPPELALLDELAPHLYILKRLLRKHMNRSQEYQHFASYMQIASKISEKFSLSEMEFDVASQVLFGRTNQEIADRNFISVATVKTHIQHIFKKTGTKNRVDFISKFFTSPERVEI